MSTTYTKNGHIHGHFNPGRHEKYDKKGRDYLTDFFKNKLWDVSDYDRDEDGFKYDRPDLVATKEGKKIFAEAAIKSSGLWKYIKPGNPNNGVDVETRKLKYFKVGDRSFVGMSNDEGEQLLLIPMECLAAAQKDCGDQFKGHMVPSSENFVMPDHGCHRVRKKCRNGYNQTGEPEDFYRIPYEYTHHYRKENGKYILHKPGEKLNEHRAIT